MSFLPPNFDYLVSRNGQYGVFEDAEHEKARIAYDCCVNDVAGACATCAKGRLYWSGKVTFDQHSFEVAALVNDRALALDLAGDVPWSRDVEIAAHRLHGTNDRDSLRCDPLTGRRFDGRNERGKNLFRGNESALALLATLQTVRYKELVR